MPAPLLITVADIVQFGRKLRFARPCCTAIIPVMAQKQGHIIIQSGVNVWPHELKTAQAFTAIGKDVEFIRRSEEQRVTSADAVIDGLVWEMKAPTADNLKAVERNLKRGRWQSENIIFDCRRMKKVPDFAIEREVRKQAFAIPRIKRLRYVNKHGHVIDIKR